MWDMMPKSKNIKSTKAMLEFSYKDIALYLLIFGLISTVLGLLIYFYSSGIAIFLLAAGLAAFVVSFGINNEKSEEHLLFSSLFTLALFLFTIIISFTLSTSNNQTIPLSISLLRDFVLVTFVFLILSLLFRFGFTHYPINLYVSYFFLFIVILIAFFTIFT